MKWPAVWLGAVIMTGGWVVAGESLKAGRANLNKIRLEIKKKKEEKIHASRRVKSLKDDVRKATREWNNARRSLAQTETKLDEAEETRRLAEERLFASTQDVREWRRRIDRGVRTYYARTVIPTEGTGVSLVYQRALLGETQKRLVAAQENHKTIENLRNDLAHAEAQLLSIRLKKQDKETRAERARARLKDLQKTEEGRRLVLDRQIQDLNAEAKTFEKKIADLIARQQRESEIQKKKTHHARFSIRSGEGRKWLGTFLRPVDGPVVVRFGKSTDPEMDVPTLSNGITFRPDPKSTVKAAKEGDVLFAGPFMNYGRMVLISHPDRIHSIYAHLGKLDVARGQTVPAGGGLGKAGVDDHGRPSVYFEVRLDGEPVNPEPWIKGQ